jgi:aminopeptidase N
MGYRAASGQTRHEMKVILYPEANSLEATDTLTLDSHANSRLLLTLNPEARIQGVSMGERSLSYSFEDGKLQVQIPNADNGKDAKVTVSYQIYFRDVAPRNPVSAEDPTYGVSGAITPDGVFLSSASQWHPTSPDSEQIFLIEVQAPEGMSAITSGRLLEMGTKSGAAISVWESQRPVPALSLSAGWYAIGESKAGTVPIYTFFSPENASLSDKYLKATAYYIQLYNELFGPYPFPKFAVVENFFPTGYGLPSYTLLGSSVIRLPFIVETSLGHEVAHSWWGNSVLVDYSHGNWSEGLTTYIADHLYKELSSPEEGREYRQQILRDYATLVSSEEDFPLSMFLGRSSPASRAVGYGKGAMVFHMARRIIGNTAFWKGLREVYRQKRFEYASWNDFALMIGKAGKRDLAPFFRQWVERPGAPMLFLENVQAIRLEGGWKVTGEIVQSSPGYELQVPLRLDTKDKDSETSNLWISRERTPFSIRCNAAPNQLAIDPDVDVFRRLHPSEIPATVNDLRGSAGPLVVISNKLSPEAVAAGKLLIPSLGLDGVDVVGEDEASETDLENRDILYLGLPAGGVSTPDIPKGLSLAQDSFIVEDVTYDNPGDALFVALHRTKGDKPGTAAIFLPLSAKAASASVHKIAHYGKYSFLVFRDGINQAKGTWPATASPLIHKFP